MKALPFSSPIGQFLQQARARPLFVQEEAESVCARANGNAGHNTYIWLARDEVIQQSRQQASLNDRGLLNGVPVSLKDCFDLAGTITSCGSKYYAGSRKPASVDSAVATSLRAAGAVIVGKTHMHQLAYGITGENPDYGDCLQPGDETALTGGSSSGAAASVLEGSALAAIGTDTGGSIRVPAALCGLAGYRGSHGLTDWTGAHHLAPSFDTAGWLFRDLRDAARLARVLWSDRTASLRDGLGDTQGSIARKRIGYPSESWLADCDATVLSMFTLWKDRLLAHGAALVELDSRFFDEALTIFAPIQAFEAARIHTGPGGDFNSNFAPDIAERLHWGAGLREKEVAYCRQQQAYFVLRMGSLFRDCDFFLMPATPASQLLAGADNSTARRRILRYTTPASVAGLPVLVLPGGRGGGMQLMAQRGEDTALLQYATYLGEALAAEAGARGQVGG